MADDTRQFIRRLVTNLSPVRPLPRPWSRTAAWCGISLPVVGLIVLALARSGGPLWVHVDRWLALEQLAALATGIAAAAAAFASTVPGASRRTALLPLGPLAIWLATLAHRCIQDALARGSHPEMLVAHWGCLPATLTIGAVPAMTIVVMLRRGVPLSPRLTTVLGALAAAGLANFAVPFVHPLDASIVVLAWHVSAVFILSILSALAGRSLFNWRQLAAGRDAMA